MKNKATRKAEALVRQASFDKQTTQQKLEAAQRFGGSAKEVKKWTAKLAEEKASKPKKEEAPVMSKTLKTK